MPTKIKLKMYSCFTLFSCFTSFEKVLLGSTKRTSYQFYYFLLFYISLYISRYLADIKTCCFYILLNGCLRVKVEIAFTTLLSFQHTAVMFEDTSVTTSDDPHFSLFVFTIFHNGAFSIWFAHMVPVAATSIALKCLSKAGLVK